MGDKSHEWQMANDPRHLCFTLARYKFVAKMFQAYEHVLEVGCGNGFGAQVVKQAVGWLDEVDLPEFDITKDARPGHDGVFMLDVFEHIPQKYEGAMLANLAKCAPVCIIGTPSLESQPYASPESKRLHVNCVSHEYLKFACSQNWEHVFPFGMNDETLHTGFGPMCHYNLMLCVNGRV